MRGLSILIMAVMIAACTGCDQPTDYGRDIPFQTIMDGALGGEERQVVVTSQSQWPEFWSTVRSGEPVVVDFEKDMAVAVFLGNRTDGGYRIKVKQVTERNNAVVVTYEEEIAGPNCIRIAMPTSPYQIITIGRTSKPVQYVKQVTTRSCDD